MDAHVRCPDCATQLRVRRERLGRQGRCPKCDLVFVLRTPVGQRVDDDESETPQVIEEPSVQEGRPAAKSRPQAEPGNPFAGLGAGGARGPDDADDEEPKPRRPRRPRPQRDEEPEERGSSRGPLLALAGVAALLLLVGGFFLVRNLTARPDQPADSEVAAAAPAKSPPTPAPTATPTAKKEPAKTNPGKGEVPQKPDELPPAKPAAPPVLKLDSPVAGLYPAGGGRYLLFHLRDRQQVVIYDVLAGKETARVPAEPGALIAGGRSNVFVSRRIDGSIARYALPDGKPGREVLTVGDNLAHLSTSSAADGPLVVINDVSTAPHQARLFDPDSLAPIGAPIENPRPGEPRAFPTALPIAFPASVSADGRAITLGFQLYARTAAGYKAAPITSSELRPVGDGSLLVGRSVTSVDGAVRLPDRPIDWSYPTADGVFFMALDYTAPPRGLRLGLYAGRGMDFLGDLPAEPVAQWLDGATKFSKTVLARHYVVLPDLGLVAFCRNGGSEVQFLPFDLPGMLARAGRDLVFTTVPPAEMPRGRAYTYSAAAVARDGTRPTFALTSAPAGMTCTPAGKVSWDPGLSAPDQVVEARLVARTADGKTAEQVIRVFPPLPTGTNVAVGPPPVFPKNPDPVVRPKNPPFEPKNPVVLPKNPAFEPKNPAFEPKGEALTSKQVRLPGAVSALAVGGAGRYICLHIPSTRQVAVFDATEAKVVRYIPAGGDKILIAAGAEKLFVVLPDDRIVQRWDLKTGTKEVTAPLPGTKAIKAAVMGSAATGPLWLVTDGRFDRGLVVVDPQTLREVEVKKDGRIDLHGLGEGVRASADGRTLGSWRFATSPSGLTTVTLSDTTLKATYAHDSVGHVSPGPDGRVMYTALGRFSADGTRLDERPKIQPGVRSSTYTFPAAGGTSLYLTRASDPFGGADERNRPLTVHWAADGRKLVDLPGVAATEFNPWDREEIGNDQRHMLLPDAKALVVLGAANDTLLVYPFDLEAVLNKSGKDYLLVEAPPAAPAVRGQPFAQKLTVLSKKGGVKAKVDSGPDGLTVSDAGAIAWAVPKDFADDEVSVIITVSDASGQEVLQTLRLSVRGEKGAAVAVAPKDGPPPAKKDGPADPKKDDPAPPAAPKGEVVTVKLPGAASAVTVGAGGKLIMLHLPQQKQIAVVDVAQGKVVKYLPTAEATVLMAAGQDHLFVANPTAKVIQRYSLKTFEKEATVPQPVDGTMAALCMGSASKGPLLVCPKGDQWGSRPVLVDPIKMKALPGSDRLPGAAPQFIRASADGRLFGWRNGTGSEGHDMTLVEVGDGPPKARTFMAGTSLLLPSPDAKYVYCGEGVFTPQFKKLYPADGNNAFTKPFLPAASGNLFMQLETGEGGGRFPGDPMAVAQPGRVNFFMPGQFRPFASIDKVEGLAGESYGYGGVRDPVMHDARVHLCPDAGRLVTIPATNDKLVLHPFDLDDLLQKSGTDYLLVTSQPPSEAVRGGWLAYTPAVRSRKGGVKVALDSGPTGMTLVGGRLTWKVPAAFADKEVDVILTVTDGTGQEVFQTFKVAVRDRRPGEALAPEPPALPKADPKDEPPPGKEPAKAAPADLTLKPAALAKDGQVVNLPSAAGEVVPAAGGRLLLIHLPKERKLAVFDTAAAKIVKYLAVPDDEAKFAAGREALVVLLPGTNVLQRWSLATLERELSVANPIGRPVKALAMGSGSDGPLVVTTKSTPNGFDSPTLLLYDVKTLKASEYEFGKGGRQTFHPQYPPEVRVSANGELITAWVWGLSPSGVYIWRREGKSYEGVHHHESWGALVPDADGRTVFASGAVATAEGKKLDGGPKGQVVPAVHGPLLLSVAGGGGDRFDPLDRGERKPARASVHIDRDSRPILTLPELDGLTGGLALERRVFLIPGAKLLAVVPAAGDKLILHRFDLDALLAKADVDYLFVASRPPASATKGQAFKYEVQVKSRQGGLKFTLDAAPEGMSIDAKGVITWAVPKDYDQKQASVILTVADKSGQEVIHSFLVPVGEAKPER